MVWLWCGCSCQNMFRGRSPLLEALQSLSRLDPLGSASPRQSAKADRVVEQWREVPPLYTCGLRVNKPGDILSSAETQREAGPLLGSPWTLRQAEPFANLKGPPGPQCNPPTGHLLLAGSSRCSLDRVQVGRGHKGHPGWTPLREPWRLGRLPRTLCRWSLSPHQAERRKSVFRRFWTSLQAQPACPEWPLSCSREVVEKEPGRGRPQESTGHQLRQGRFCFPRTIFTSGDGLEKWRRDLWGAVMWIPSLRGQKLFL